MTTTLQRLLLDHIRRGGWYWLFVGFMQLSAVFGYALWRQTTLIAYPMMGAIFAPMMLNVAEQRGWFQILLTLPLARRDIARERWWAAIGAPGLFLTALSVVALAVFAALGWKLRPSWQIGLWLLSGWAILGLFAQARSWLRVRPGGALTATRCLVAAFYISLAMLASFFTGSEGYGRLLAIAATTAGLVVDAYLYWCAERLLFWQVGRTGVATSIGKERSKATIASYGAGWSALIDQWARRLAAFAALVAVAMGGVALILRAEGVGGHFAFMVVILLGAFAVGSCAIASPWLAAARAFRTLPLGTDRLAAALLLLAMAPAWAVLLMVFVTSLLFPAAAASVFSPVSLLPVALASLLVPCLLRFGQQTALRVAMPVIAAPPILDPMMPIFHPDLAAALVRPWTGAIVLIAAIAGYLSFLWTRHELRVGRKAYRQAALPSQNATA